MEKIDWNNHNEVLEEKKVFTPNFEFFKKSLEYDNIKSNIIMLGAGKNLSDLELVNELPYSKKTIIDMDGSVKEFLDKNKLDRFVLITDNFNNLDEDMVASFVSANYSLSWISKEDFIKLVGKINSILSKDGYFQGNIFGMNDDWNSDNFNDNDFSKYNIEEVREILKNFEIINIDNIEYDKTTNIGKMKHWEEIRFLVKK